LAVFDLSVLELVAFTVSVLGVWLTTARSLWNYPFSLLSVALYGVFFFRIKLYADTGLQVIFALMLVYGWWQWSRGRGGDGALVVLRVGRAEALVSIVAGVALAVLLGFWLHDRTDASLPWADSALFAASLIGSLWAARRYVESWWVWIAVDLCYVGLYLVKRAYPTALLYAVFVALAALGLRRWRVALDAHAADALRGGEALRS
jgi:nicotinamide mononucleotide transporter